MSDISAFYPPNNHPIHGSIADATSFEGVQDRLLEAWGFLRRMPDREAGWLRDAKASSIYQRGQLAARETWALYQIDSDDYDRDALPKLPGLRSAEVDRMDEALGWIAWVDARDRKLVAVVLAQLHNDAARPSWTGAARALGFGGHPDTLAKRYSRAITRIAVKLGRGEKPGNLHLEVSSK